MTGIHVLSFTRWYPLHALGFTDPWWAVHFETVLATWVVIGILVCGIIGARVALKYSPFARFIVVSTLRSFFDTCTQVLGSFSYNHISFLLSLCLFLFLCNTISTFIPWLREPTSDLNTALALGIISFLYVQAGSIYAQGIKEYVREICTPFFMFPMHIIGKLATILSMSFRLFGNIFGGAIITEIYNGMKAGSILFETFLLCTGVNTVISVFFGIFEGLIQTFVFFMLTLTYLAIGTHTHDSTEDQIV